MLNEKKCILYVYKGHLGLPSLDYKCLQALFTAKLKNSQKIEIRSSGFYITPNFPMLEYDGQFYSTQANILTKLEEIIEHSDTKHNVKKSRIKAYKALAYQSLEPCVILNFWGNEKNCQYLLKLYGSEKYFPFKLIYLRRMNTHVQDIVTQYSQAVVGDSEVTKVHDILETYLVDISHLLSIHKYLLGDVPSSLDAYVCGYLAPIYALNFPDKTLKSILLKYDVVLKYLGNYLKHYGIKITPEPLPRTIQNLDENDRASLGLLATAGFVAMSLMIGYAIMNDVFKIK